MAPLTREQERALALARARVRVQQAATPAAEPSALDKLRSTVRGRALAAGTLGLPEAAVTALSGLASAAVGGAVGVSQDIGNALHLPELFGTPRGESADTIRAIQEGGVIDPVSGPGKDMAAAVAAPFDVLHTHVAAPSGEAVANVAGPAAGSAVEAIIDAAPMLLGARRGSGAPVPRVRAGGHLARRLADLFQGQEGVNRIVTRHDQRLVGKGPGDIANVATAAEQAKALVPGDSPNIAQALAKEPAGSPIIANMEVVASKPEGPSARFGERLVQQADARIAARKAVETEYGPVRERLLDEANRKGAADANLENPVAPGQPPLKVQRYEEMGAAPGSVDKPQGLYTTHASVESPHANLGGPQRVLNTNPKAQVLTVDTLPTYKGPRGISGESGGMATLRVLLGEPETRALIGMDKAGVLSKVTREFPAVEWSRYFDKQEILEGYAGLKARAAGYDAIWAKDPQGPQWSEYIGLNQKAFLENPVAPGQPPHTGIKFGGVVSSLEKLKSAKGNAEVADGALEAVAQRLAEKVQPNGLIDARDLYALRKDIGLKIQAFAETQVGKNKKGWGKGQTRILERKIQLVIDNAIENAAQAPKGQGWTATYMEPYAKRMQQIEASEARAKLAKKPPQKTSISGFDAAETPRKLSIFSRTASLANYLLTGAADLANPKIAAEHARRYLNPSEFARALREGPTKPGSSSKMQILPRSVLLQTPEERRRLLAAQALRQ